MIAQRLSSIDLSLPRWAFVPLRDFYIAFAWIGIASSILAVGQAFGYHPLLQWQPEQSPGLFFNPVHAGQTLALIILLCVIHNLRWFIPFLAPGLYLAHSRGAWLALALGLLANWFRRPLWLLVLVLALGVAFSLHPNPSDLQRLDIWKAAYLHLTFWGNGWDSFWNLYMGPRSAVVHPEYVHNDYLQTVFEFGVWSLIPFAILAWAASKTSAPDWPILIAFLLMACFSMPMHMPLTLVIGAIALATTLRGNHG